MRRRKKKGVYFDFALKHASGRSQVCFRFLFGLLLLLFLLLFSFVVVVVVETFVEDQGYREKQHLVVIF